MVSLQDILELEDNSEYSLLVIYPIKVSFLKFSKLFKKVVVFANSEQSYLDITKEILNLSITNVILSHEEVTCFTNFDELIRVYKYCIINSEVDRVFFPNMTIIEGDTDKDNIIHLQDGYNILYDKKLKNYDKLEKSYVDENKKKWTLNNYCFNDSEPVIVFNHNKVIVKFDTSILVGVIDRNLLRWSNGTCWTSCNIMYKKQFVDGFGHIWKFKLDKIVNKNNMRSLNYIYDDDKKTVNVKDLNLIGQIIKDTSKIIWSNKTIWESLV